MFSNIASPSGGNDVETVTRYAAVMDRPFLLLTATLSAATFGGVWLLLAPATQAAAGGEPFYPGCRAARTAGVAPIHRGQPGYRIGLDGDGDGIACEWSPEGGDRHGGRRSRRRRFS
jgi:hypothetical protein